MQEGGKPGGNEHPENHQAAAKCSSESRSSSVYLDLSFEKDFPFGWFYSELELCLFDGTLQIFMPGIAYITCICGSILKKIPTAITNCYLQIK